MKITMGKWIAELNIIELFKWSKQTEYFFFNLLLSDCGVEHDNILCVPSNSRGKISSNVLGFRVQQKGSGPLSQIEDASSSVNEEVLGSAFRLKAASPRSRELER